MRTPTASFESPRPRPRDDAGMSLAYALRKAARPGKRRRAARETLELYERQGHVADALRARATLEEFSAS
jgi:hypothetical protein